MKKHLQEIAPQSARALATPPAPVGRAMLLDDLDHDHPRAQHVEASLERALPPRPREVAPTSFRPEFSTRTTKMIATPIDGRLRQSVRTIRAQYEISESFVVETALRLFFADRSLADIAADLRARGGRLRRSR